MEKLDPYKNKERYLAWKKTIHSQIPDISKENSDLTLRFLNDKYPKRWFFIVSNKNLLSKYSKLGPTIQRKDAQDKLKQLLR